MNPSTDSYGEELRALANRIMQREGFVGGFAIAKHQAHEENIAWNTRRKGPKTIPIAASETA